MKKNNSRRKQGQPARISRRTLLKGVLAMEVTSALGGCGTAKKEEITSSPPARDVDLIRRENQRAGDKGWMLTNTRIDPKARYRCPWIEGYCSRTSVRAGESIDLFVSTNPSSPFTIDIYRMGYYGGAGGRRVASLGSFKGKTQAEAPVGENRVRECRWEAVSTLKIPADWVSGVYLGKLTAEKEGLQSYVIFIVRDDRQADFMFQCSDNTWQAYNRWPSQFALYDDGKNEWYWGPGSDVSFDRPYGKYCQILDAPLSTGSGEWFLWEYPLAYWMEQRGYDVTYISNMDTHADPSGLLRAKGFLSIGHDEYYSIEMFNNLKGAIDKGLNVAFLSGNTCCGRIDPRPSSSGVGNRIFGRMDRYGPREEEELKHFPTMGKLPFISPNESSLVGARSTGYITGGGDYVCSKPNHWIFEGTGMKEGEGIPGLIGWEWHGDPATAIKGLEIVSAGPTRSSPTATPHGTYTSTIYPGPRGNFVFNASTCWWADGLAAPPGYIRPAVYTKPGGPDERCQRITTNILDRIRGVMV
jgi:hypothetical protein